MKKGKTKKSSADTYWDCYIGKRVRLIVEDTPYPRPRDGIFCGYDHTHFFLKVTNEDIPKPFLRISIKRIDLFKHGTDEVEHV